MSNWQQVTRTRGPVDETINAPRGWEYDVTAIEAWYWLVAYTRNTKFRIVRDRTINDSKIEVLSQVLANSLGMSSYYWSDKARELVDR